VVQHNWVAAGPDTSAVGLGKPVVAVGQCILVAAGIPDGPNIHMVVGPGCYGVRV
ncbi:hypothetical protein Tco_0670267, partial [Tanacetum coccineum]